jgi:hypothetical protein
LFAAVSFAIFALSYFMRAAYPPDASFWVFAAPTLVQGFAMGAVIKAVVNQAYLLSSLDLFYLFGWTVLLLIPICWIARRPAGGGAVAGGE